MPPADPPEWEANAAHFFPPAPGETAINPHDTTGEVGVVGTFFGLAAGVILLFHQRGFDVRLKPEGEWWKRGVRFVIGVIGVAILWLGLRMVFPRDASLVPQTLRYVRYALTGFWVAYGAPRVFLKLKLLVWTIVKCWQVTHENEQSETRAKGRLAITALC